MELAAAAASAEKGKKEGRKRGMIIEASTPMLTASLSLSTCKPSNHKRVEWNGVSADLNSEDFVVFTSALSLSLTYRAPGKSMYFLLSRTQAGPCRTVKQEQEEMSPNHVQRLNLPSVATNYLMRRYKKTHMSVIEMRIHNVRFAIERQSNLKGRRSLAVIGKRGILIERGNRSDH